MTEPLLRILSALQIDALHEAGFVVVPAADTPERCGPTFGQSECVGDLLARDFLVGASKAFGISKEDLTGPSRIRTIVRPRQIAMAAAADLDHLSYSKIARAFGDRDHTTVRHAAMVITEMVAKNPRGEIAAQVRAVTASAVDASRIRRARVYHASA